MVPLTSYLSEMLRMSVRRIGYWWGRGDFEVSLFAGWLWGEHGLRFGANHAVCAFWDFRGLVILLGCLMVY